MILYWLQQKHFFTPICRTRMHKKSCQIALICFSLQYYKLVVNSNILYIYAFFAWIRIIYLVIQFWFLLFSTEKVVILFISHAWLNAWLVTIITVKYCQCLTLGKHNFELQIAHMYSIFRTIIIIKCPWQY